ncbi:FGGY family of carbohydrate kinase [Aspergillus pseudodeflectus]|uniref:FGGY family of carbohydrate kinase n=1 Tax=Aspergillus pseudodeflectus TaxID=176178 RepID=A0ABR4JSB2_9EURO
MQLLKSYYIGVDVGTGSARACVIDDTGDIVSLASEDIGLWNPQQEYYEQSTTDIWRSICSSVRRALAEGNIDPDKVRGMGFDATCSLAVFNSETDKPVSISSPGFDTDRNVILWLDHRAMRETEEIINATGHKVLRYTGGKMSPEMEIPKILWLKRNMAADVFAKCKFYDLVDALTHIATGGEETRSLCSLVCKQAYLPKGVEGSTLGWQRDFLEEIGLGDLAAREFEQIGGTGQHLHAGDLAGVLCDKAAKELGLPAGIAIGSGVIDAYAGWIGTIGADVDLDEEKEEVEEEDNNSTAKPKDRQRSRVFTRLAAVAGTSTCHLAMSPRAVFVAGIWGPYRDTIFPGCWMAEGGQSATGQLLKHVLESHPVYKHALSAADELKMNIFQFLNGHLYAMARDSRASSIAYLARHFFFYGDLFGNRSPLADSTMTGAIVGLTSDTSLDGLAIHYYGTLEFIALQTRHIVETMNASGHAIRSIFMSGSQCQNEILVNLIASACRMPVVIPHYVTAAVCHGAAILGARAAALAAGGGDGAGSNATTKGEPRVDLWEVMQNMSKPGKVFYPTERQDEMALLAVKYQVFLDQACKQREYRSLVDRALNE